MTSVFNNPFLVGFEEIEKTLRQMDNIGQDGYPHYNIEQTGTDSLAITIALAGFNRDEIDLYVENQRLVVRGKRKEADGAKRHFIHQGIAMRQFERTFVLAEGMKVMEAELTDGLLVIQLERPPASSRVQKVEIKQGNKALPKS